MFEDYLIKPALALRCTFDHRSIISFPIVFSVVFIIFDLSFYSFIKLAIQQTFSEVVIWIDAFISFFFLRFYLFIHERHREKERQRHRQREKQTPRREPDVGLDPGSPVSHPGLKAALNRWATWATQWFYFFKIWAISWMWCHSPKWKP